MIYIQYEFFTQDEAQRDAIISLLPEIGFDGFEELETSVKAFVPQSSLSEQELNDLISQHHLDGIRQEHILIQPKNWNEEWESNFSPVMIAGRVSIRAPFHKPQKADYELIIEPKMSFGTGHHPTTSLMIQQMLTMEIVEKELVDFGCGTGILAIMAAKLGAKNILAIDHEEWAAENSKENTQRNNTPDVTVLHADSMNVTDRKFDIMLANINRNVILASIASWYNFLKPDGVLVVSGILVADIADITTAAEAVGLRADKTMTENGWASILFKLVKFSH